MIKKRERFQKKEIKSVVHTRERIIFQMFVSCRMGEGLVPPLPPPPAAAPKAALPDEGLKTIFVPRSLKTKRNNPTSHHKCPNQKLFFSKPSYLSITSKETVKNSKSKSKKFSFLCTFKLLNFYFSADKDLVFHSNVDLDPAF
jgi:hypothetical protein